MKRGRRWVVVAVVALTVALLTGAFVFRERSPYEFLRGAKRLRTEVKSDAFTGDYAALTYEDTSSNAELYTRAEEELLAKGWSNEGGVLVAPRGASSSVGFYSTETQYIIYVCHPATTIDRFNAWLDRLMRR